tara:strand:- start:51327 stop:52337 length:1011 start_codon:yes stop_codon:yes gene_type:complete
MAKEDPLGHQCLLERIGSITEKAAILLKDPVSIRPTHPDAPIIVTGVGSSQAHAQYLAYLINQYTSTTAVALPLVSFTKKLPPSTNEHTLIVFSQGLSSNARIALKHCNAFKETFLITAQSSPTQDLAPEIKPIHIPCDEEKGLLIRTIGPFLGFLASLQLVEYVWPGAIPSCTEETLLEALKTTPQKSQALQKELSLEACQAGCTFLTTPGLALSCYNLGFKFLEGLFLPMPAIWDILTFTHGPFQQLRQHPGPILSLTGNQKDNMLFQKAETMITACSTTHAQLQATLSSPWSILEYEMILNHWLLGELKKSSIDQKNWPGKGEDAKLYDIDYL